MAEETLTRVKEESGGNGQSRGSLKFSRVYTTPGINPLDEIEYEIRDSGIYDRDTNELISGMQGVEVPREWSQSATDIAVDKYFRKKGVPGTGHETSARQLVDRVSGSIRQWGEQKGYFDTSEDADIFEAELSSILIHQKGAFNSPVWFNVGLKEKYGIEGGKSGNWAWDEDKGKVVQVEDSYSRPQASACFIQSVDDDLETMLELQKREVMLFKYGSGTGTNFSNVRAEGEKLSGGGESSGLISFLNGYNSWAGGTKSGGTTRRAAKMVSLDYDHPEIEKFIFWKTLGERMVNVLKESGYSSDFEGESYTFAPGQNSNNSVRVTDEIMKGVQDPEAFFETTERTTGNVRDRIKSADLLRMVAEATWESGDPGMQYDTTINRWHTCPNTGRINGSNPCSEYMFLDDSACNLASINLLKFWDERNREFDVDGFKHVVRTFITAQEILVGYASYPGEKIGINSENYRPLGLGYANLGALAMVMGMPYDSDEARALAGSLTAILTGEAYAQSARIAGTPIGPFNGFEENREPFFRVMEMHRDATKGLSKVDGLENLVETARDVWDEVVELGKQNGYRNAQASVLAPTGTIAFLMDCDTTGIEPDFALKKWKKLAGGGGMEVINKSVPRALRNLGYDENQVSEINKYVAGHGQEEINEAPEIKPEHVDQLRASDNLYGKQKKGDWEKGDLESLGYSDEQITEIRKFVDGRNSVEGAPYLSEEHYAIFDTANSSEFGTRFISPMGHVKMMAATQPFISGAISKTVNFPREATVEDIQEIYKSAWEMGIKALAVYRDGSKGSQPLNTSKSEKREGKEENLEGRLLWGERKRLPDKREGLTQKLNVGGVNLHLRTGEYEEGALGEIFIDAFKGGSEWKTALGMIGFFASKAMQYGMPPEELVDDLIGTQAEPRGPTSGSKGLHMTTSIYDAIGRVLGVEYFGDKNQVNNPDEVNLGETRGVQIRRRAIAQKFLEQIEGKEGDELNKILGEILEDSKKDSPKKSSKKSLQYGPPCRRCGTTTIKSGTCANCPNCGENEGCG